MIKKESHSLSKSPPMKTILKKMHYQSWHRGMKEMDFFLGNFFDHHVNDFSSEDLLCYSKLLMEDDNTLYSWLFIEKTNINQAYIPLINKIKEFYTDKDYSIK